MMNRIAVVLRGHIRTWEYNAPAVFDFYDSISENVDYYFVTWNTPHVRTEKVNHAFESAGKQYTKFLTAEVPTRYYTSWAGPAYLSTLISPFVRQNHRVTPYDVVFDSRPDVVVGRTGMPFTPIAENTLYTTTFTNLLDRYGNRNVGMKDHFLASTMEVYSTMNDRIVVDSGDTKECHCDMLDFAKKQGFSVSNSLTWMQTEMSRPNDIFKCKDSRLFFYNDDQDETQIDDCRRWHELSPEERRAICEDQNIEKYDYITNNGNIAIENVTSEVLSTLTQDSIKYS